MTRGRVPVTRGRVDGQYKGESVDRNDVIEAP
jgi:hypothetical protein